MRQVFLQKGNIQIKETNPPLIEDTHVLVRVDYSFISSGTEGSTIAGSSKSLVSRYFENITSHTKKLKDAIQSNGLAGTMALIKEKNIQLMPLGYSCAGQIIATGKKIESFRIGDYVACAGSSYAYHADMVSVPQNLVVKLNDQSRIKETSLATIGAIALQGIRRAQLQIGETVCVIGLGLIGQITVQLAKNAGCNVIGIDLQEDRLTLAKKLGADLCLNPQAHSIEQEVQHATGHHGVDTTIITAASQSGLIIDQSMKITRKKGRVVLVGDVKLDFSRDDFYVKEIDFLISSSYGPGRYDTSYERDGIDYPYPYVRWTENRNMRCFVRLVEENKINIKPLISSEFTIDQAEEAYSHLKKNTSLGILLAYPKKYERTFEQLSNRQLNKIIPYTRHKKNLNLGFIGVGGFAKTKLLPIVSKIKNVKLHTIIDADAAKTLTLAKLYNAQKVGNSHTKVMLDDEIDTIVIATPHSFHAKQALECLQTGKGVFIEKPAAVTFDQLEDLQTFFSINKNSLFCVDFNRSFSPFVQKIKTVIDQRNNPLMITYRVNPGYLSQDHWVQSDTNGGRIIGEACHFFELFCFLTNAKPVMVSVASLNPKTNDVLLTDNFTAQISMSDGSCCTLIYSSQGNTSSGKEYMELFFDGKTIVMNDFLSLKGYGLPSSFNESVKQQDKGHQKLLEKFFDAAQNKGAPNPIPHDRIIMATQISLVVDTLARKGGGLEFFT